MRLVNTLEEYDIELTRTLGEQLWSLSTEYATLGVLGSKRTFDLLHYASATLLGCTHLVSWDKRHFNDRVEERLNRVNASRNLTTLKVDDPFMLRGSSELNKERRVTRDDLQRIRSDLSRELNELSPKRKKEYLEAADQVYNGLAKMAKIRPIKA